MSTAQLLTDYEQCPRRGFFGRSWVAKRLYPTQMVREALHDALTATEGHPWGELAGSTLLQLAHDRGLDTTTHKIYDSACHHACLVDLLATVLRKPQEPAWITPPFLQHWKSACYISPCGTTLRRLVIVSNWSEERHYSEARSWFTMGEQAAYNLPMQLIWLVIGQQRDGLRSSPWTTGFLHKNHDLRFRKRKRGVKQEGNVFSDSWERIHREDHGEISREKWLDAMITDDVLQEVCFREDLPELPAPHLVRIQDLAKRKLEKIDNLKLKPEANLSSCEWPVPCPFRKMCHILPEKEPSERYGFIRLSPDTFAPSVQFEQSAPSRRPELTPSSAKAGILE